MDRDGGDRGEAPRKKKETKEIPEVDWAPGEKDGDMCSVEFAGEKSWIKRLTGF